ncbi:MAG: carboxypeptidase M32 [Candidatus Nanohaloarchaea archaeon]
MEFEEFRESIEEIYVLEDSSSFLGWDQEVMMPEEGIKARKKHTEVISGITHRKMSSDDLLEARKSLDEDELDQGQKSVLREVKRRQERARKVPEKLQKKISGKSSEAVESWRKAKSEDDFGIFEDNLREMVELKRELAKEIDPDEEPYRVLFREFEPYLDFDRVEEVMEELGEKLPEMLETIREKGKKVEGKALDVSLPEEKNMELARKTAGEIGFDFTRGRIDTSDHPFTTGNQFDTRITTRFSDDSVLENIAITMHETGHALYTQGVTDEKYGTPLGCPREMVIHESQSRLWENHVGRSRPFWKYFAGELRNFSEEFSDLAPEEAWKSVNKVEFDNRIRTEADEISYHLHIVLRFEIGRQLVNGDADVDELPELWNRKMEELLDVEVESDSDGVLQDIHWGWGSFGYFPTYSLGSVLAAQIYDSASEDLDGLEEDLQNGEFEPLLEWLRKNIHSMGQQLETGDLIIQATGEPLNAEHFLNYIREKYSGLYAIDL